MHQAKCANDETERAARCFPPCLRQFVVKLRVFELRKLQRQRFFQDHDIDALAEQGTQQGLAGRYAALARGNGNNDQRFCKHQP